LFSLLSELPGFRIWTHASSLLTKCTTM
jgi:hypothetical protein